MRPFQNIEFSLYDKMFQLNFDIIKGFSKTLSKRYTIYLKNSQTTNLFDRAVEVLIELSTFSLA